MVMRRLISILILLGGVVALGAVGRAALNYKPFVTAPPVPVELAEARPGLAPGRAGEIEVLSQDSLKPYMAAITRGIDTPPLTETENILLAGIDSRPWAHGGRTDALVVVVIHRKSGHVGLVSIPRDLLVAIPGDEPNRINTVYAKGRKVGGAEQGVALLRQVIRHALGLPISSVLFLDHGGFEGLVDALGGVSVQVICPIEDRFLDPRGPGGRLPLKLEAGSHHLDGRTALMFVRSRHGRGLLDRSRRHQAMLVALRQRAAELGAGRVKALLPAVKKTLYTDMTAGQMLKLLARISRLKRERIHGLHLGRKQATPVTMDGGRWVMVPQPDAIAAALKGLFSSGPPGHRDPATCPEMKAAFKARKNPRRLVKTPARYP